MTGFYGEPMTHKRTESWSMLHQLNSKFNLPWLCAGDFNELLQSSEKLGGNNRSQNQMQLLCMKLVKILVEWERGVIPFYQKKKRLLEFFYNNNNLKSI